MKKIVLILTIAVIFAMTATAALAQPFSPNIAGDTYGISQGGGNTSVPTPRDNNDGPSGPDRADINDAINLLLGQNLPHNSDYDNLQWTAGDKHWKDLSTSSNTGTFVAISLTAANTNTLQVYDTAVPGTKLDVLPGLTGFGYTGDGTSAATAFLAGLSPLSYGTDFGWALESVNGSPVTWDSDWAENDGYDHMLTYHLTDLIGDSVWIKTGCNENPIDIDGAAPTGCTTSQYTFKDPYLITWEDLAYANGKLGDEDYDDMIFLVDGVTPHTPEPATMLLLGSGLFGLVGMRRKRS